MTTTTEEVEYRSAMLRIKYFDVRVRAVLIGKSAFFPTRALCKAMGLSYRAQQRRLNTDTRLLVHQKMLPVETGTRGQQDTNCIHREGVSVWFTLVDPAKCTLAATRERLNKFQHELFAAADRFLFGDTSDVVYDEANGRSEIIIGTIGVGHCPGCGLALKLNYTDTGAHLAPDTEEEQ